MSEEYSASVVVDSLCTWQVLQDVADERTRQNAKWGEQDHDPETWLAILVEEVGELATAMIRDRFGDRDHAADMQTEAIQVAAVAVALVECLKRGHEAQEAGR